MRRDDILSAVINTISIPFILVWGLIKLIVKGVRRVLIDMFKNVYGRFIALLVTIALGLFFTSLFK
jgi:hypothetical protein